MYDYCFARLQWNNLMISLKMQEYIIRNSYFTSSTDYNLEVLIIENVLVRHDNKLIEVKFFLLPTFSLDTHKKFAYIIIFKFVYKINFSSTILFNHSIKFLQIRKSITL